MSMSSTRIDGKRCLTPLRSSNSTRASCAVWIRQFADQGIDVVPTGAEPEIAFAMEIDRRGIAVHRHQRLELAVDLVPVLRHADILGHGEQLADAAGGARRGGKFVGRVRLDDDHVRGMARQRQVVGDARSRSLRRR